MRRRFNRKVEEEEEVSKEDEVETSWTGKIGAQMLGFPCEELKSLERFSGAMYRPTDAACLGVVRAMFGLCMLVDVTEERGLSTVDAKWGDPRVCHFPLIPGLRPLSLPWMIVVYGVMWLGALGIALGYRFRVTCGMFVLPYWYLFLLDKSFWNNHSYLYGVVGVLLWGTDAHKYFSLDSRRYGKKYETVPYWNYFILKYQFFILYFMAGLKKSSWEWLEGYSMTNLSRHWVFHPFKLLMSSEQTDFYIVHWFAFLFDLSVGFFMLLDRTRFVAMLFCTAFHLMNSRLFDIGMFPYVCLATMPLFCRPDWPRKLPGLAGCDFEEEEREDGRKRNKRKEKLVAGVLAAHVVLQLFLPYSHFLTKGYNNWVPGLYGYSWDMMMHAWDTVLVAVRVHDNQSHKDHFLDPDVWAPNDRWAKHGDMLWQYARCIKDNIEKLQEERSKNPWVSELSSNLSIYVDVWCSLNGRFQQRLFDPGVDLLKAEWHPFKPISYLMPLLRQFSSYRSELERIQRDVYSWSNYTDVLFVADFPGMTLENYASDDLTNVTLHVLEGEVAYHQDGRTVRRRKAEFVDVRTGSFHRVVTASPHPACYMYTFANRTKQQLDDSGMREEPKEAFPIAKEIGYKLRAVLRSLRHVYNGLAHLLLGVPMPARKTRPNV